MGVEADAKVGHRVGVRVPWWVLGCHGGVQGVGAKVGVHLGHDAHRAREGCQVCTWANHP